MRLSEEVNPLKGRRIIRVFQILCAIAIVKGSVDLLMALLAHWYAPLHSDAHIYFAVGRGILNGFDPYGDLFENKPPGIFLLSSLSLFLDGTKSFAMLAQAKAILAIPFLTAFIALREVPRDARFRSLWIMAFFLMGIAVAKYIEENAGYIQTESFGVFFVLLYILVMVWRKEGILWRQSIIGGFFVFLAVEMKEPLILVVLSVALLLSKDISSFFRSFVLPSLIASVLFAASLVGLGYWQSYLTVYLPYMVGSHIFRRGPLALRVFNAPQIILHIEAFSPLFFLVLLLLACGVLLLAFPAGRRIRLVAAFLLSFLSPFVPLAVLFGVAKIQGLPFALQSLLRVFSQMSENTLLTVVWFGAFFVLLGMVLGVLSLWKYSEPRRRVSTVVGILRIASACALAALAVGLGGQYYPHHFVLLAPLFVMLCLFWLKFSIRAASSPVLYSFQGTVLALLLLSLFLKPSITFPKENPADKEHRAVAARLDSLMDSCGFDRYFFYGFEGEDLWAWTRHSPYGSSYTGITWDLDHSREPFRSLFLERIRSTLFIVTTQNRLGDLYEAENEGIRSLFTLTTPPCADSSAPVSDYVLLYRQQAGF